MVSLGKINLEEVAPDHPFVSGCILFVPKPPTVSKIASKHTKPDDHVKKNPPEGDAELPTGEK